MNNIGYYLNEKESINELILHIEKVFNTHKVLGFSTYFSDDKKERLYKEKIKAFKFDFFGEDISIESRIMHVPELDSKYYTDIKYVMFVAYNKSFNKEYFNTVHDLLSTGLTLENRMEIYSQLLKKYNYPENEILDFITFLNVKHDELRKNKEEAKVEKVLSRYRKNSSIYYEESQLAEKKNVNNCPPLEQWKKDAVIFTELFYKHGLKSLSCNDDTFLKFLLKGRCNVAGLSRDLFSIEFEESVPMNKRQKMNHILTNMIEENAYFLESLFKEWKRHVNFKEVENSGFTIKDAKKININKNLLNLFIHSREKERHSVFNYNFSHQEDMLAFKSELKRMAINFKEYNWIQEDIATSPDSHEKQAEIHTPVPKKKRM